MTTVQRVAQLFGWGFVVLAIWGGFVAGTSMVAEPALAPRLWGLFPVNFPHNLVHLAFGLWGLRAARSVSLARLFAYVGGTFYLVLAVLGLISGSMFGLMPIGGNDVWLHGLIAIVLLGAGMTVTAEGPPDSPPGS